MGDNVGTYTHLSSRRGTVGKVPAPDSKPSIGRIVHYTNLGDRDGKFPPEIQAAIITGLNQDDTVSLHVLYRSGQFNMPSVAHTDEPAGTDAARGKWTWPART